MGTHQRLIHCDVKSANILLDDHWHAMVADFGFSTMGPANELHSTVVNRAAGTYGYCDPEYANTSTLTKESDVYSFGVVLVEVLCGALCYTLDSNGSAEYNLVPTWIKSYEENTLNDTIFKDSATQPMHESVLQIISDIAYQCLKESREDRPTMAEVVTQLETTLNIHELLQNQEFISNWNVQGVYYKAITKNAEPPLSYSSEDELKNLLSKGVLLSGGKTWFSLNKNGEHCEMISIAECLGSDFESAYREVKSRFPMGTYFSTEGIFNTRVKAQFLSPGITYTVNLVFKFTQSYYEDRNARLIYLKYKLQGEKDSSHAYLAYEREDGWWMCELYQFTSDNRTVDLKILFQGWKRICIEADGIEIRPLEKVEHKEDENQPILDSNSDSDANWEEKLPTDYEDIMKQSKNSMQGTTKEESYSIIRKGFLIIMSGESIWFSLDKNGKKCHMLSAVHICKSRSWEILPLPESRFREAFPCDSWHFDLKYKVQSQLVSSQTTYAIYLVYKLSEDQSGFESPMSVVDEEFLGSGDKIRYIYLLTPQTPVIKPKAGQSTHNPPNKLIKESLPQQRNDGWMEVQLWEFQSTTTIDMIPTQLYLRTTSDWRKKKFMGLIIEGIEIRPI